MVIVDPHGHFYPPAAHAIGIHLSNLIILKRGTQKTQANDFLWAIDQSLRCNAVAAVWGQLPEFETTTQANHWQRRFQLSAESSGCCGMFVKNQSKPSAPSWAEIQWQLRPLANQKRFGDTRHIRASLVRCRGAVTGKHIDLKINTITGNVQQVQREHATRKNTAAYSLPLAAELANPKTRRRAARA